MTRIASVLVFAAALAVPQAVAAQTSIKLEPMKGDSAVEVEDTKLYSGSCGPAAVVVVGVVDASDEYFKLREGRIIVRRGPKQQLLLTDSGSYLSDYNGMACVQTPAGSRLLVWSKCGGAICTDEWNFIVIDPDRPAVIAPKERPPKGSCDAQCASQVLGSNLPLDIAKR